MVRLEVLSAVSQEQRRGEEAARGESGLHDVGRSGSEQSGRKLPHRCGPRGEPRQPPHPLVQPADDQQVQRDAPHREVGEFPRVDARLSFGDSVPGIRNPLDGHEMVAESRRGGGGG